MKIRRLLLALLVSTRGNVIYASSAFTSSSTNIASDFGVLTYASANGTFLHNASKTSTQKLTSTSTFVSKNAPLMHDSIQMLSSQTAMSTHSSTFKNLTSLNLTTPHLYNSTLSSNLTNIHSPSVLTGAAEKSNNRAVFAHFMLGNVPSWDVPAWKADITLAMEAHIDAFALNIAFGDEGNQNSIANAFSAAESQGFKLFFSFDYAGGISAWPLGTVVDYINQYSSSSSYFQYLGKPFVSTFEGPASSKDWSTIKSSTGCFFIPDWSSLGAKAALKLDEADGLFSWAAWPWGTDDMDTHVDASYLQFLNQTGTPLPYMMPVSPWFFTNLPGYHKNWMWRSDDLWFDRWQEVWYVRPDLVEIISWNDYGESHYIGPLHSDSYGAFDVDTGNPPYNYALDMPHDGWRMFLPYVIDMYKYGTASVTQEGLVTWYRLSPANAACSSGNTSANTHTQFQVEFEPAIVAEDRIFYSALLARNADVTVTIGSSVITGKWRNIPDGGIGMYHGSVLTGGKTGAVTVILSRSGVTLATVIGARITEDCPKGIQNWNAWVGAASGTSIPSATPTLTLEEQVCVNGTGVNNFVELCEFACGHGYCPIGACTCYAMGKQVTLPPSVGVKGYPKAGESEDYSGLCAFACDLGYCPDTACGTVSFPLSTPSVSPFDPLACTSGLGVGNLGGLCDFACSFGYCPLHSCSCGSKGNLAALPAYTPMVVKPAPGLDEFIYGDLCQFACEYGYCPPGACEISTGASETVYVDQIIFVEPTPVFVCPPPCTFVMPSSTMNSETVITFPPISTSIVVGGSTLLSVTPAPMTTSVISFFDMSIDAGESSFTFALTSSFEPEPLIITVGIITTTVYFLPVAGSALDLATPDIYYSLGTTVYLSGSVTQVFSEAQFTNLRTLTAPTITTTSLVERSTGSSTTSSTTTLIPIWVQAGGFYWSPVPIPTPLPIKIPSLPEFPPIPNPPCFKFLDIFSIDCPPDKSKSTSTFRSGKSVEPTCTSNCGSPCTANCYTTGTPTSTECATETATNYWVSCASSTCVTTSSNTVTGCAVEPSVTTFTATDYCPLVALPTGDDEGSTNHSILDCDTNYYLRAGVYIGIIIYCYLRINNCKWSGI